MKKYGIYIAMLLLGIGIGYIIFGSNSKTKKLVHQENKPTNISWTCSMHLSVMLENKGDCPICGMELIPTNEDKMELSKEQFRLTENAMALANIQTTVIGKSNEDTNVIQLSGKIRENEDASAVEVIHFSGRIEKLYVDTVGENVSKGKLIALIYSPELVAAQQELITVSGLKKTQRALYSAVRNKLKIWKLSDAQIDQIETSKKIIEKFPVYAADSGTIISKMVDEGDHVNKGQVLYKTTNLKTIWAQFDAYENQIAKIKKGQKIRIKSVANPNTEIEARITFIDPIFNANTRTVIVRSVFENKNGVYKPGMFIKGRIDILSENQEQLLIPKSAVLWTGKRSIVYVKIHKTQPIFAMRKVVLGKSMGDTYEILEGLKKDEEVVTNGVFTIDASAQLQGKKSMMNAKTDDNDIDRSRNMGAMRLSKAFQEKLYLALQSYFLLKDALVAGDIDNVLTNANEMKMVMKRMVIKENGGSEQSYVNQSIETLTYIEKQKSIKEQRLLFISLNENMIPILNAMNTLPESMYIQECPMANQNKGAYWLSREKEIRNPYYGEKMLKCGSVVKEYSSL